MHVGAPNHCHYHELSYNEGPHNDPGLYRSCIVLSTFRHCTSNSMLQLRYLAVQGSVQAIDLESPAAGEAGAPPAAPLSPQAMALEMFCR